MRNQRVALIVDNPGRDLDGLVLVSKCLAEQGVEAYLVPMYTQAREVPALRPDLVLVNYARVANRHLIQAYSDLGIAVGVLDTEGGMWESQEQFIRSVDHQFSDLSIDLYCLWGETQREAFKKLTPVNAEKLAVTGCPRYDYCAEPWINLVKPAIVSERPVILVISNSCLAYPRYARSGLEEVENMTKTGYERAYAMERLAFDQQSRREILNVVPKLAADFSHCEIVVRPHPFEDDRELCEKFQNLKNVSIRRDLTVTPWIKAASVIVHVNSSVAVDTFLMGKPLISLGWVDQSLKEYMEQVTWLVSSKAADSEDLNQQIQLALIGKWKFKAPESVREAIEGWFYKSDGNHAERVANAIVNTLRLKQKQVFTQKCLKTAFVGVRPSWLTWVDSMGSMLLGSLRYSVWRTWLRALVKTGKVSFQSKNNKFMQVSEVQKRS